MTRQQEGTRVTRQNGITPTTATTSPTGWPARTRAYTMALADLAERAYAEKWHLDPDATERYEQARLELRRKYGIPDRTW